MAEKYSDKLKDPRWQKKRLEILERDHWGCQCCYDEESTLHVHHRKYLPNTDPWDYPNDLLITLCENCHTKEREERPEYEQYLLDALRLNFLADDLLRLTTGFSKLRLQHVPEVVASVIEWSLSDEGVQRQLIDQFFENLHKEYLEKSKNAKSNT